MNEGLARRIVYARSGGLCEPRIPDAGCRHTGAQWHHRKRRSQGGRWTPSNGLHICLPCHDYVTDTNGNYESCVPGLLGRGLGDALAVQGGVEGQLGSVRPAARGLT